jgi:uncharacterized protein YjbJ (UPF0337 family)
MVQLFSTIMAEIEAERGYHKLSPKAEALVGKYIRAEVDAMWGIPDSWRAKIQEGLNNIQRKKDELINKAKNLFNEKKDELQKNLGNILHDKVNTVVNQAQGKLKEVTGNKAEAEAEGIFDGLTDYLHDSANKIKKSR